MLHFIKGLQEYHNGNRIYESVKEFVTENILGISKEDLDHMMANSMIQTDIIPEACSQILTLSTCTSTDEQKYRFIVNGLLEKTESTVQRSFPEK